MEKEYSRIKAHKIISDIIDNGFVLLFFAIIICLFFKPVLGVIIFLLALMYFIAYFCIVVPIFNKYRNGIKNKINEECRKRLDNWIENQTNEVKEKYSIYLNEQFIKTRDKRFLEFNDLEVLLNIEEDILLLTE